MITKFNLFRTSLIQGSGISSRYKWCLEIRFEVEDRDHEDYYVDATGTEKQFSYYGDTYNELAKVVFKNRGEFLSLLRVAEYVAGQRHSRLHMLQGLRSSRFFEDLLSTLGILENFTTFGVTHHTWVEWELVPFNFVLDSQ